MNEKAKQVINSIPLSSYRKKIMSKTKCIPHEDMLKTIQKYLTEMSELYCISKTIILSMLFQYKFKKQRFEDAMFGEEDFWEANNYIDKLDEDFVDESAVFPENYTQLKMTLFGNQYLSEENINDIINKGYNRSRVVVALLLSEGDSKEALDRLKNKQDISELEQIMRIDSFNLRGVIKPPQKTLFECPILRLSDELYFDCCIEYKSEKDIIDAIKNGEVKKSLRKIYNEVKEKFDAKQAEKDQKADEGDESIVCCDICFENCEKSEMFVNRCGHQCCMNCLRDYLLEKTKSSNDTIGIVKCIESGCKCAMTMDIFRLVLSDFDYYRYCEQIITQFISQNVDMLFKFCSNQKCTKIIHSTSRTLDNNLTAMCECQAAICLNCGQTNHKPATCDMWEKWHELLQKDGLNLKWIRENSRPCPKCKKPIEKNGGCQWMCCMHCKGFFCWVCMQVTNDHQHKPGQVCKPYHPEEDTAEYLDEETLQFVSHYDLQDIGVKQALERNVKILDILTNHDCALSLSPLYEASLMEIDAHLILRNLNVLQYYSKEQRQLLEFQIEQFKLPAEHLTKEIQKILSENIFDLSTMSSLTNRVQSVKNIFNRVMESFEFDDF